MPGGHAETPGAKVPAEMNQMSKEQFVNHFMNFLAFQAIICKEDDSVLADFGTFTNNYEE